MNMTLIAYYQKGRLQGPVWHLLEENGYLISDNLESSGTSIYIYPGTVFENHRKSLIQHCERSELRLHFEWTKDN